MDVDNTGGTCDGTVYAVFGDTSSSASASDIFVSRSTNGGASWQTPVKVNDDATSRTQFHPFLVVDQSNGQVVVAWHDARNDSNNRKVDFFTARSTDCGQTFQTNVQASAASSEFNNSGISYSDMNTTDNSNANPNQYGEYLGLDAQNCKAYMAWTDTRHYFPSSSTESQEENLGFSDGRLRVRHGRSGLRQQRGRDGGDLRRHRPERRLLHRLRLHRWHPRLQLHLRRL